MLIKRKYNFSQQLVRDFIYDRLYHAQEGYFTKNIQLGQLKKPIDFKNLMGYEDYMKALQENYPEYKWLTPSEVFRPYYGISIGNYIQQQFAFTQKQRLKIVEVGAGYGAACEGILYYFKNYAPSIYPQLEYNIVEISPIACELAKQRLQTDFSQLLKKGNVKIHQTDFLNYKPITQKSELWVIVFLEVFDNLPHDKVIPDSQSQVLVENNMEILQPITDSLIKETYDHYRKFTNEDIDQVKDSKINQGLSSLVNRYYGKKSIYSFKQDRQELFLPTISVQVLKHIKKYFTNPSLLVGDFDMLNNQFTSKAINCPIVSKKLQKPHEKNDFESYIVERGSADIFFPTDFRFLQYLAKEYMGINTQVQKAHTFMDKFSKSQWTTTQSGYNPLKEDFGNTSFLLTDHS